MAKFKKVKDRLKCNKPTDSYKSDKDHMVKACEDGKEKLVHYGDPDMKDRPNNKKARKSFRARHKCDEKKSKLTAGYWACKDW
jgi:hypothetical protein